MLSFISTSTIINKEKPKSIYDIKLNDIDGKKIDLRSYKGKFILFVNVASKCGFTRQYEELQHLYENYSEKLMIIALPCNQFGSQEPGNSNEIKRFCKKNYGVTFLVSEKIDVKGKNQHALYKWLTNKDYNNVSSSSVRWNFQKYIVDKNGKLLDYFYSLTKPSSNKILKLIS